MQPVAIDTDAFLKARIMFTQQYSNGDAFNELASWWRLSQTDVPHPGATWFLLPRWPRPESVSGRPAVVDDFGTLVPVEWLS